MIRGKYGRAGAGIKLIKSKSTLEWSPLLAAPNGLGWATAGVKKEAILVTSSSKRHALIIVRFCSSTRTTGAWR